MPFPLLILLGAMVLGAAVASIYWSEIAGWFGMNKRNYDDYGEMLRERLADGKVRVVSGIFNANGQLQVTNQWVGEEDQEIQSVFNGYDHVRVTI